MIDLNKFNSTAYEIEGVYCYNFKLVTLYDKVYIFGGGGNHGVLIQKGSAVSMFYKIANGVNDAFLIPCSSGTSKPDCALCPEGTYDAGNNVCTPCPAGTYSKILGAVSIFQCTFCPHGWYNDVTGATFCKQCSINFFCSIGATKELVYYENLVNYSSNQPAAYQGRSDEVTFITYLIESVAMSIAIFIFIVSCFYSPLKKHLKSFDLMDVNHPTEVDKPIYRLENSTGGIFSIIFMAASCYLISSLVLSYFIDNIVETKTLVPSIIYQQTIGSPEVSITFSLFSYGGNCINNNQQGICSSGVFINEKSLSYSKRSLSCMLSNSSTSPKICALNVIYQNLFINFSSSVTIQILETNSFAEYISINVTSDSSIPEQISNIFVLFQPDLNLVFRGKNPSVLTLDVTPSVLII